MARIKIKNKEEMAEKIVSLLVSGVDKHKIANDLKCDYSFVMHIAKTRSAIINRQKRSISNSNIEIEPTKEEIFLTDVAPEITSEKPDNDELTLQVVNDYEKGYSVCEIAERNKISKNHMYKLMYDFYGSKEEFQAHSRKPGRINLSNEKEDRDTTNMKGRKNTKTEEEVKVISDAKEEDKNISILNIGYGDIVLDAKLFPSSEIIKCDLVNNRHETGQDLHIFNHIAEDKIFDFEWQKQQVENFILTNVDEGKTLCVFCTGLQSALISVISVCLKYNINVVFMHWSSSNNCYYKQTLVNTDYEKDNDDSLSKFENCSKKTLINSRAIFNNEEAVLIQINKHDDVGHTGERWNLVFDKLDSDVWSCYSKIVDHIQSIKPEIAKFSTFIARIEKKNNQYMFADKNFLAKTYNFHLNNNGTGTK